MDNATHTIESVIEEAVKAAVLRVLGEISSPATEPVPKKDKLTMSIKELAAQLGISVPKATDMTHIEGFPVLCVGRRRLIPIDAFHSWLAANHGQVI